MDSNIKISPGIMGLMANAHSKSSFEGKRHYFTGDLCQMNTARRTAESLGIEIDIEGGIPFVKSEEDFDRVKKYLISNKLDGWWHYVSHEEYCKIRGKYTFGGKYLRYQKEVQQIADELGIEVQKSSVLFATSKEDFDAIVEKLNIAD